MTVTTFAVEISYTAQIPADQLTEMVGEERDCEQESLRIARMLSAAAYTPRRRWWRWWGR